MLTVSVKFRALLSMNKSFGALLSVLLQSGCNYSIESDDIQGPAK